MAATRATPPRRTRSTSPASPGATPSTTTAATSATTPSPYPYPIDTDCDFVGQYEALPAPNDTFPFLDDDVEDAAADAGFLGRSFVLHAVGVPRALDVLGQRILSGETDLCDDLLVDALECRRRRILFGDHPTFQAVAQVAASSLGISSPMGGGVQPNHSVAALRSELEQDFIDIACGEPHQVNCAQNRFKALQRRYFGEFSTSLSDAGRLTIRKDAIALQRDAVILGAPPVISAYGSLCGDDMLSIALAILGRPRREQVTAQERLAFVQEFNQLAALEQAPTPSEVQEFVGAYRTVCPRATCRGRCDSSQAGGQMIGPG